MPSMALKKTLVERLFNISKLSSQTLANCRISSTSAALRLSHSPSGTNIAPDPGDDGVFRRFFHKKAICKPKISPWMPIGGEGLMQKLKTIDIAKDRIRLDGLSPPPKISEEEKAAKLTVVEARKFLKVMQMEKVKEKLRDMEKSWVSYSEFVRVCEEVCADPKLGLQFAKLLDESGNVIVFGDVVCIRPEQVTKVIEGLIPQQEVAVPNPNDPKLKELEELEKQKAAIDKKADTLVRRELWGGLGYLVIQTAAFMRLTFWELSWDVMEPICFYVTSVYFMAGYAFFLRTTKEPSFEGFYQSRFNAKQKKLIKANDFDVRRYNELRKILYPGQVSPAAARFDHHCEKMKICDCALDN